MSDVKVRPASEKHVQPCPHCGEGWPVVQAFWATGGGQKELALVCTACGIVGRIERDRKG